MRRRRLLTLLATLAILSLLLVVVLSGGGSGTPSSHGVTSTSAHGATSTSAHPSPGASPAQATRAARANLPPSLEAGIEPWQLGAAVSRETVLVDQGGLEILGGLVPSGASAIGAFRLDPATGASTPVGSLAAAVHDGAGAVLGSSSFVFGGGSPATVANVQTNGRSPACLHRGVASASSARDR